MAEFAAKPYEELIQLIRTGPPRLSPFRLKQLDEAANTVEFYVHTEDVRRAQPDWTPRELDPVFQDALWSRLEQAARLMGRRSPVGLVLRRPDGQTAVAHRGTPVVTVTGEPGELLLFAVRPAGRGAAWSWRATRTRSRELHEIEAARVRAGRAVRPTAGRPPARSGAPGPERRRPTVSAPGGPPPAGRP